MPVVVSPEAVQDLGSIQAYLAARNPVAAIAVTARLSEAMLSLEGMPSRGRHGLIAGTRELKVAPYIITYRVTPHDVEIVRVWHGTQARS